MTGPLTGIRVADFTWVWAGPMCTMQLAHMGAEVIRMETTGRICTVRMLPPWPGGAPNPNASGYFNQYNQGKRSVLLNLQTEEGRDLAKQIVAKSDIAVENFASGIIDKLGLGYEDLRKVKADLVMISMSGYGRIGPESAYVSYGPAQVPMSGLSTLTGYKDWHPMHVGMSYGDPNAGLHAAFAVIAALFHRDRTGKGQYIDMSQWDSSMSVLGEAFLQYQMTGSQPERNGNRVPHMSPHGVFMAAGDDAWISIACRSDDEWRRLTEVMGRPELADDARYRTLADRQANEDDLEMAIMEWTLAQDPFDAMEALQAAGIPAYPPLRNREVLDNPQLANRDFWVEKEHPVVGTRRHAGIPYRMSETPAEVRSAAPIMGGDNAYVLNELLGLSEAEVTALTERGVIK